MVGIVLRLVGAAFILGFVLFAVQLGRAPLNLLWVYLVLGGLSLFNYWRDKRAAQRDERRVPERSLLGLDLVFGIIGGLVAQALLRHKNAKPEFGAATGLIAALHLVVLALLILGFIDFPGLR
jgi:uncharacterized membrane protein YsdA (DUF1294 family)